MKYNKAPFSIGNDLPSSIVVFFVALPLCLGIAHGSDTPLLSGIIAGIVGGIVVGVISGSRFGVSGPAAGLMTLVGGAMLSFQKTLEHANNDLPYDGIMADAFSLLLLSVVIAGVFQILLGALKLGFIAYYFPNSVINGMLAGIGVTIFLKQIPHAVGYDRVDEGSEGMFQEDGQTMVSELVNMLDYVNYGAIIISIISLVVLILFQKKFISEHRLLKYIPGSMIAVLIGIFLNQMFINTPNFELGGEHLVNLGGLNGPKDFFESLAFPNFLAGLKLPSVWITGAVIALVASLETLLCVEATDKLDPNKNVTPTNRELIAQGAGNVVSGLVGGLPITQVIVRSSANISAGAKSKWSSVMHGVLLFLCVLLIPTVLKLIPLSALAAVLLVVGYKLAHPKKFIESFHEGWSQFIPFIVTVVMVWFWGLLWGVGIGLGLAFLFILYNNFAHSYYFKTEDHHPGEPYIIHLSEHMTFLNKASLIKVFKEIPNGSKVIIDMTHTLNMDADILDTIKNFEINAAERKIMITFEGIPGKDESTSLETFLQLKKQYLLGTKQSLSKLMDANKSDLENE